MNAYIDAILLSALLPVILFFAFMLGMLWNFGTKVEKCLGVAILVINAISFCINIFLLC